MSALASFSKMHLDPQLMASQSIYLAIEAMFQYSQRYLLQSFLLDMLKYTWEMIA